MVRSTGGDRDDDFEREWQALTEQLRDLSPADLPDEVGDAPPSTPERADVDADDAGAGWGSRSDLGLAGPRDYEPPEEEGFVPPEPEPIVTRHRPWLVAGWAGLVAGLGVLLVAAFVRTLPAIVAQAAGAVTLISFGVLLSQLPKGRRDEDDPDKGAVV